MSIKLKIFFPVFVLLIVAFSTVYFILSSRTSEVLYEQNITFMRSYVNNVYNQVDIIDKQSEIQNELLNIQTKKTFKRTC